MDTSETYQEMCYEAERIAPELFYKSYYDVHDYTFRVEGNDLLWWLPRQDQLQILSGLSLWKLNFKFDEWLYDLDDNGNCDFHVKHKHGDFTSMEQLSLAFTMSEKCSKIWNGTEWVKDSRGISVINGSHYPTAPEYTFPKE